MQNIRCIKNVSLCEVITEAKRRGYKVYTSESHSRYITYVFYVSQEGEIGYCQTHYSGITFSSVHRPNKRCGTGFSMGEEFEEPKNLDIAFGHVPKWGGKYRKDVKKYANWEDYTGSGTNTILKYYEL